MQDYHAEKAGTDRERSGPIDLFEEQLDRFSNSLDRLETRLAPALAPPSPEAALTEAQFYQSPFALQVSRLSDRLDRLDSLMNRIEL